MTEADIRDVLAAFAACEDKSPAAFEASLRVRLARKSASAAVTTKSAGPAADNRTMRELFSELIAKVATDQGMSISAFLRDRPVLYAAVAGPDSACTPDVVLKHRAARETAAELGTEISTKVAALEDSGEVPKGFGLRALCATAEGKALYERYCEAQHTQSVPAHEIA